MTKFTIIELPNHINEIIFNYYDEELLLYIESDASIGGDYYCNFLYTSILSKSKWEELKYGMNTTFDYIEVSMGERSIEIEDVLEKIKVSDNIEEIERFKSLPFTKKIKVVISDTISKSIYYEFSTVDDFISDIENSIDKFRIDHGLVIDSEDDLDNENAKSIIPLIREFYDCYRILQLKNKYHNEENLIGKWLQNDDVDCFAFGLTSYKPETNDDVYTNVINNFIELPAPPINTVIYDKYIKAREAAERYRL